MDIQQVQRTLPPGVINAGAESVAPQREENSPAQIKVMETGDGGGQQNAIDERQQRRAYTPEELQKETERLNRAAQLFNTRIRFGIDNETKEPYVLVIDAENNHIIRRIPPEDLFKASLGLQSMVGIFFDMFV